MTAPDVKDLTDLSHLTDEEVMQYADQVENPWVDRMLQIILQLETELAYRTEEAMQLRIKYDQYND